MDRRNFIGQEAYILPKSKEYSTSTDLLGYKDFTLKPENPNGLNVKFYKEVFIPDLKAQAELDEQKKKDEEADAAAKKQKLAGKLKKSIPGFETREELAEKVEQIQASARRKKEAQNPTVAPGMHLADTSIGGKYYKILDCFQNGGYNDNGVYLELLDKDTKDTFYYMVAEQSGFVKNCENCAFIIAGNFVKTKATSINKKFILQKNLGGLIDVNTGESFEAWSGSEWTCIDYTISEFMAYAYPKQVYILKDSINHQIAVGNEYYHMKGGLMAQIHEFKSKAEIEKEEKIKQEKIAKELAEQAKKDKEERLNALQYKNEMIRRYGNRLGTLIADGQVEFGMNMKMCIDAWGQPSNTISSQNAYGKTESWFYSGTRMLFFSNGILKTITQ